MRTTRFYSLILLAAMVSVFAACQKNAVSPSSTTTNATTTGVIAITTSTGLAGSSSSTTTDSIYLTGCFGDHDKKDTVAFSPIPAAVGTYLTANYDGYTFVKGYQITNDTKTVINYIVVIKLNGNLIGLKFTATGVFVNVLEQREGDDLKGPGFHHGGPFDDREGFHKDTIALSAIPTVVKTFFSITYPTDTLLHAVVAHDNIYILISKNQTLYATTITDGGKLVRRIQIDANPAKHTAVLQAALPAAITTYLTATYPGYVFDKAFSASNKSGVLEYSVFITSNSTRYVVRFDASGVFIKVMPVR